MTVPVIAPGKTKIGWIGTGVMGGMITATVLAVFFVPIFFVVVRRIFKGNERQRKLYAAHLHQNEA